MLRLVFAGTPDFAASALAALHDAGHEIALVLTRPDQPAGRGQALRESPVKRLALARGLPLEQPRTLRDPALQDRLRALDADAMVVAAYGAILPAEVLAIPRHGCLNIHASLLPRWRGAAPIQRAIEAGDAETGVTIMQMDEGLDTGAMLLVARTPIDEDDTAGSVHDRLAELGARAIVDALAALERGELVATAQPDQGVTYARKLTRDDAAIDWTKPARSIVDRVRAFDPAPGATARLDDAAGTTIKVWRAAPWMGAGRKLPAPGTVLDVPGRLVVACGDGAVDLLELQKPGGRRLAVGEFLRGFGVAAGAGFVVPEPRSS
ncbi:MAG: methionyl-tRNA formyltransferase [Burkholderiaceae bacterium]|nr:methionyl-tRNA formyltransferase [Burkholderiaceae bacterium]